MYNRSDSPRAVLLSMAAMVGKQFSNCTRSMVGAVVWDPHTGEMAVGHNAAPGIPSGDGETPPPCDGTGCPRGAYTYAELGPGGSYSNCNAIHAEMRAINRYLRNRIISDKTQLYVSRKPCDECMVSIKAHGFIPENVIWSK